MSGAWWVKSTELIDEQLHVLEIPLSESLLIAGPPGSGKTNLLLLRANHLHLAEKSEFYIVTFTRLLALFIGTGAAQYSFPVEKIVTQNRLFRQVLADQGFAVDSDDDVAFSESREQLNQQLKLMMATGKGRHSFPVLFVDEAQDYTEFEIQVFKYLGRAVCMTADMRQGLYQRKNSIAQIGDGVPHQIALKHHFRNGKKILACADKLMHGKLDHVPMLPTSHYPEDKLPSSVDVSGGQNLEAQLDSVCERLLQQIKAYPEEILGVLVPIRADVDAVWTYLGSSPALKGAITNAHSRDFDPICPVWISTIHSAKGLEFRAVHIVSAEKVAKFTAHARRVAFTAITRAKTALSIYHDGPLPAYLDAALAKPDNSAIEIDQLFGSKE